MSRLNDFGDEIYNLQETRTGDSTGPLLPRKPNLRRVIYFWLVTGVIVLLSASAVFIYGPGVGRLSYLNRLVNSVWDKSSNPAPSLSEMVSAEDTTNQEYLALEGAEQLFTEGPSLESSRPLTEIADLGTMGIGNLQATEEPKEIAQLFDEAEIAFARQAWMEALTLYIEVRSIDNSYESDVVGEHMALAYHNSAMELIKDSPENDLNLETARRYLREAIALNPNDTVAVEEYALLTSYLAGIRSLAFQEPGAALELLLEVYETRPNYLNGFAAQQLYDAYIALGDMTFRRGATDEARELYRRAAALQLEGKDAANVRLASMDELYKLTPTPFPANLPTVQAAAVARGLPPVLLPTPTPASVAEATARAEYATAVAVTTGTFTPEPEAYVTPVLVIPSPPVESIATEVARAVAATARASAILIPTNTPMPYNAVIGEYVYATPVPENAATAQAQAVIAEANQILYGTPTPLPWHAVVITQVPTPLPPTSTPIPLPPTNTPLPLLVPVSGLTATPTLQPTAVPPDTLPPELRNKIVFQSDRGGGEQTYILDPDSGEVSLVTQGWVYPLAEEQLGFAADGKREAIVLADNNRILQIQIRDHEFDVTRQVTAVSKAQNRDAMAYDPAWSPTSETIAYVNSEFAGDEIYTINLADGIPHRLTNNTWEWDKHPTWSPDGSQIIFYSNRETGRMQLWIMNADGSNPRNLSNNEYNDWDPIWIR